MTSLALPRGGWSAIPGPTLLLMASVLSTGASGLVTEYVLASVSTNILGNSIEQFSIVIAVMFLTMGSAAFLQKFTGDTYLVEKFVAIEITLSLLGGFAPLILYAAFVHFADHFAIVQIITVGVIGFLIGFEIPLVIRINERFVGSLRSNLGWILSMDFIGGFVGAMIWVRYFLGSPLTEVSFVISGFNFAVATATILYFMRAKALSYAKLSAAALALAAGALSYGWAHNADWSISIEQRMYRSPIIHAETSKFQRIVLTHNKEGDDYRLYLNGGLQFSSKDEPVYHEHIVHPVMALAPRRERVLILGGGDGLVLREVLKYPEVREVLLVDIDPAVVRLSSTHPVLRALNQDAFADARVSATSSSAVSGAGFRRLYQETGELDSKGKPETMKVATMKVLTVDAFKFIADIGAGPWDVVILDFPDPDQVELAKLYSREFYRMLSETLSENGLIAVQATSPYHAKEAFLCIGRTLAAGGFQVIPYHANVPSFGDWGWYLGSLKDDPSVLKKKMSAISIPVETSHLTEESVLASLAFGKGQLSARFGEVNTVMNPVVTQYYSRYAWKEDD